MERRRTLLRQMDICIVMAFQDDRVKVVRSWGDKRETGEREEKRVGSEVVQACVNVSSVGNRHGAHKAQGTGKAYKCRTSTASTG